MDRTLLVVFLVAIAPLAGAQVVDLPPGAHVRIEAPTVAARRFEATVLARMDDTLAVQLEDRPPLRIWMARIRALEVGSPSRLVGAYRGAGFGLPVGMGVAYYGIAHATCTLGSCSRIRPATVTTLVFGAIGATIGAFVGGERWNLLDLTPHSASSFEVNSNGVGLRFGF